MPLKTGSSHAIAALVSMVVGSVLTKYVKAFVPPLAEVGVLIGDAITLALGVSLPKRLTGSMVVVAILSFVWGILYHFARHS